MSSQTHTNMLPWTHTVWSSSSAVQTNLLLHSCHEEWVVPALCNLTSINRSRWLGNHRCEVTSAVVKVKYNWTHYKSQGFSLKTGPLPPHKCSTRSCARDNKAKHICPRKPEVSSESNLTLSFHGRNAFEPQKLPEGVFFFSFFLETHFIKEPRCWWWNKPEKK